jgi:CHC2 zinc finger
MNVREIAALAPMARLLESLGFEVNERTKRCACILHGGSNRSAFSWTESGLWKCHSCGAGGDRIALVRVAKKCSFREAVEFLSVLAGVTCRVGRISRREIERVQARRERLERAAWIFRDEEIRLLRFYGDGLHRAERFMARLCEAQDAGTEAWWERVARFAPVQTYFLAAYTFLCDASRETIVRFVLTSPAKRRAMIYGEDADEQRAAA